MPSRHPTATGGIPPDFRHNDVHTERTAGAMTTDTAELISTDQAWRQRELAYAAAYAGAHPETIVIEED